MKRVLAAAAIAASVVYACASDPAVRPEPTLTVDDLLRAPFSQKGAEIVSPDAILAALPPDVSLRYGDAVISNELGAVVFDDIVLTVEGLPGVEFTADQITLWGPDPEAIAGLWGARKDRPLRKLFERMVINNLQSVGLQNAAGAQSYRVSVDRLAVAGLDGRASSPQPVYGESAAISVLRRAADLAGAYRFEGAAYSGFKFEMLDNAGNGATLNVGEAFSRGYDQGRIAYQQASAIVSRTQAAPGAAAPIYVSDANENLHGGEEQPRSSQSFDKILQPQMREAFDRALKNPVAAIAQAAGQTSSAVSMDVVEMRDADFSGALSWLARWETPPISETNLLDLGSMVILNETQQVNGVTLLTRERSEISAGDFYWLVPSQLSFAETGVQINIGAFLDISSAAVPEAEMAQARAALEALGLDAVRYDSENRWRWNGKTGDADYSMSVDAADLASFDVFTAGGGPSLTRWNAIADGAASPSAISEEVLLKSLTATLRNSGALEKAFAFAETQTAASAEDLRQSVPALMQLYFSQFAQSSPRLFGFAGPLSAFLSEGGTLQLKASPDKPVSLKALEEMGRDPYAAAELLDLSLEHQR
ncbi:MAG: hypothetical protein AAGD92_10505 [Pseudomonadota bacterium]